MRPASGDQGPRGLVVPMFPLPNVFLFPGTVVPLHIFEPRYRRMIEDSLDGPGRIVMAAVLEGDGADLAGSPPVHPVGGLGEIAHHDRLSDGRFLIWMAGLARVAIREVPSDRPYRKVEAIPLCEVPVARRASKRVRERLVAALRERCGGDVELPCDMPLGQLADLLLLRLGLPHERMQELFACVTIAERAREALVEHARRPIGSAD
jgi:Lon protease-like protein